MTDTKLKFEMILELVALGERAFIHKLKKVNPRITPAEIDEAVTAWYHDRPAAALGDAEGVPGDIRRFDPCGNSNK